jgi:subtilisin family serine protease
MTQDDETVVGQKRAGAPPRRLATIPGQLIVRIRRGAMRRMLAAVRPKLRRGEAAPLPEEVAQPLDYLRANAGLKAVRPLFSTRRAAIQRAALPSARRHRLAALSSVADAESDDLAGIAVLSVDPQKVTTRLINTLLASPAVEYVEPMPARWPAAERVDPMRNLQWGLRAVEWFAADLPDAREIRVGILDTGIDTAHPDLRAVPITYHHAGLKAEDIVGHGTHVAGIIAATPNNGIGIAGLSTCRLDVWKVFPDEPLLGAFYVDGERYLQALNAVIAAGVMVLNLSLGGVVPSRTEALLFRRLADAGVTVVAAMGNEHEQGNPTEYPAAYDGVLAVGAIAENRERAPFSNTGRHIALVAPGSHILSTVPVRASRYRTDTGYASWSGTSMATPHVAAGAALVAARFPEKDSGQISDRLRRTTTRLPAMRGRRWTPAYGAGLLNLRKALA